MPRLFIALPIAQDVITRLTEFTSREVEGLRWVRPESMHLTLLFLGNVEEPAIEAVRRALRRAARPIKPFKLSAERLGAFPNEARAEILWTGIAGELDALHALHGRLKRELRAERLEVEERAYRPHVTLARSRAPRPVPPQLDPDTAFGEWTAGELVLFESQLSRSGPRYLVRIRVPLGQAGPRDLGGRSEQAD